MHVRRVLVAFLVVVVIIVLGAWVWISLPLIEAPKFKAELVSPPPEKVSPGDTFEISVQVVNEGGGHVEDIYIRLEMPEGFISHVTGTNTRTVGPDSLSPHDGIGQGFVITVSKNVTPGSYAMRIVVTADNISPHIIPIEIEVVRD
ncbi:MAG: NEW3 domain-containing protein [Candidatus Bathyarchaeota archaeon]|nr:NEW3 domain-containing protein [Candidatus Bathyarchaeota archaeon]